MMPKPSSPQTFYDVITAAIKDMSKHGYDSQKRLDFWLSTIRDSAVATLRPMPVMRKELDATFKTIYKRMVDNGELIKRNPSVGHFGINKVKPKLRAELERRTAASAQLIKLNRQMMLAKTEQRFSGCATSVPAGGSKAIDAPKVEANVGKALTQLPFEERRVMIDQGHKFVATLNNIVAVDNGALAMQWHSQWRRKGYDFREDHKERDEKYYMIRGNWAELKGLIQPGPAGYTDEITAPGEEVFCSCFGQYIYALRDLPANMLTKLGAEMLAKVRVSA
jgi:hypothetical protein